MHDDMRPARRDAVLDRVATVLEPVTRSTRLLDTIGWPRSVERDFFAKGAGTLPRPVYEIDRDAAEKNLAALASLARELEGDGTLLAWLRELCASYADANRMALAVGKRAFYEHSVRLYGGARTTALDSDTTNLDLALHVGERLGARMQDANAQKLSTDEFISELEQQLGRRRPRLEIELVREPELSAKVIAGMKRVRVREGATFSRGEALSLYHHEIETHALTAQNGAAQKRVPFLRGGGPRTTRTQEGLAVFSELYAHALGTDRLARLVDRVELVAMAEDGASFLDLYRHLLELGEPSRDAYLGAQRICRGGLVEGGAPFTKDASYLSGLMDVYNFLRVAVRSCARDVVEVLVSGRIALDDVGALVGLRSAGVLEPPKLVPPWLAEWDGFLTYFAFTSFLNEVDLQPVEARHRALLERAGAAKRR